MTRIRTTAALAAALLAGAALLGGCAGSGTTGDSASVEGAAAVAEAPAPDMMVTDTAAGTMPMDGKQGAASQVAPDGREIIRTGYMTMNVESVGTSIADVHRIIASNGGVVSAEDQSTGGSDSQSIDSATITAQVPADKLDAFIAEVSELGTVQGLSVSAQDVTQQGVDLDARIAALKASIAKMNDLMAQATKIDDLLAIETQLAQRQAELDSLVAQRTWLSSQVAMSTMTITLLPTTTIADVEVPGFVSGLASGWSALVALAKISLTALGFVLPFLVIALIILVPLAAWLVRRARRRQPAGQAVTTPATSESVMREGE